MPTPVDSVPTVVVIKEVLQVLLTLPIEKLRAIQDYALFLQADRNGAAQVNGNGLAHGREQTGYDILLTQQPDHSYLARPVLMPELVVAGKDEQEAVARACEAIARHQIESRVVHVTLPTGKQPEDDPWLRFAGMWEDDPNWEQFQADIAAYRQQIDQQMQPTLAQE